MELGRLWVLRGPNIWARVPVIEVEVELGETVVWPADLGDRLAERLALLKGSSPDRPKDDLRSAPTPAHALQHVRLELQCLAGSDVAFGATREGVRPGQWRSAVEYEEEPLARACLETARALCLAAMQDRPFDLAAEVRKLRELSYEVRLGPSTAAIVQAARRRGIPVRRLNEASLVQLGHGARARRICTAETDRTSALAEAIAQDKELTRSLLRAVGVPVPDGRPVSDAGDAWIAAEEIGLPIVVKPRDGNHGRGVTTNLSTRDAVVRAYDAARAESDQVMVERFIPGADYRLLVIDGRLVAAALREPAHVIGDGRSTITQLVEVANRDPRRSDGHSTVLSCIKLDPLALEVLADQCFTSESTPPAEVRVLIRRNGNLSTGGTATDVTDRVHPNVAARAVEAARAVGLDIAGVDVVTADIAQPLEEVGGGVVEVNAGPGLRMHLEPSAGKPRPVGEAIVNMLFPAGQTGRIPIAAVTGVNGKTTTTRLLTHLLRQAGQVVGMTCTDGAFIDDRRIETGDCSGPRSARSVLLNPRIEAAVFETARGGILREGLGFEQCDVAVVTNVGGGDHLGLRGVRTIEELAQVKRTVVEAVAPGGAAVLNAADPLVVAMAGHCPGSVIFFARDAGWPGLAAYRSSGGRTAFVRAGAIVLDDGGREEQLLPLQRVPLTHGGGVGFQVENVLAASAAAWALGLRLDVIRMGLETFAGDAVQSPGRFNVFRLGAATVIVDYAHNRSALTALVASLDAFPHRCRTAVFTGFDRQDADVIEIGEVLGRGFDRVILVTDRDNRERADGELNGLLRQGLARGKRVGEVREAASERLAILETLQALRPGDLLVLGIELIEESLAFTEEQLRTREATVSSAWDNR
jgi:cyanophycin synthetase